MAEISAQVSLYPLRQPDLGPPIRAAWRIFEEQGLEIERGAMSTVVWGNEGAVMEALKEVFERARAEGEVVMVITLSDEEKGYDIEFRVADVRTLAGSQNTFDYVVANQAVHCMRDQEGGLRAIYDLLKKGGKFVCSDLSVGLLGFLHHSFHSFLGLSAEEWESLLARCGFIQVKIHQVNDFCVVEAQKPAEKNDQQRND